MQATVGGTDALRVERGFDAAGKFMPDGLALIGGFDLLAQGERHFISRIQGRSYVHMLGLLRFTGADRERQALLRRMDARMTGCMPAGYCFVPDPVVVAGMIQRRSAWAVLALNCLVDLLVKTHYRLSIDPDHALDSLWQDVFLFRWKEETPRMALDELQWRGANTQLDEPARDRAVGDLIGLIGVLDGVLQAQARADAGYFSRTCGRMLDGGERARVGAGLLHAYRWQYILCGVQVPHFSTLLSGMLNAAQYGRIAAALAPLFGGAAVPGVRAEAAGRSGR
jgi:hypothetical protein